MNSTYEEWAAGVKQIQPEHKADAETIQIMLADWTADRAALLGLVRELYHAFAEFHRDDFGEDSEEWEHHRTHDDCWICALLARADAALAGEPGEGGEQAKAELLNALAVVTLLRLARGRMQHIIETAAVAMTHAEVRMTQDVIAQIDAACAPEKPQEGKRG